MMAVRRTLQLPDLGDAAGGVQVTLYQRLTSQALPFDDGQQEVTCDIPVVTTDGAASHVKLRVRREAPRGIKEGSEATNSERDYLEQHKLQHQLQALIQDVLRAQPGDPFAFMAESLREGRRERVEAMQPAAGEAKAKGAVVCPPLAPRPPEKPPPAAAAFRKARHHAGAAAAPLSAPQAVAGPEEVAKTRAQTGYAHEESPGIMEKALQAAIDGVRRSAESEARAASLPEYQAAVSCWAVKALLCSAANLISADEDLRRRCFADGACPLRTLAPAPMVHISSRWQATA